MFGTTPSPIPPEEEPVTSRDESGEPSGDEDPANEREQLERKEEAESGSVGTAERAVPASPPVSSAERAVPASPPVSSAERAVPASPPVSSAEQAAPASPPVSSEEPLARAQRERDEYLDLARRAQADFENYRKRAAKEAATAGVRAKSGLVRELLPVVDNLERALASANEGEQHLAEGVRLVHSELIAVLERNGVEPFDPRGDKFDPTEHEALSTRGGDGSESGVVLDVVEKGYRANGTVLRPARVVVSA